MKLLLQRIRTSDEGTVGVLSPLNIFILELPWRNNEKQYSCISEGSYLCKWKKSPKFGWCYQVTDVPGRGNILLHSGNFAGDTKLEYLSHSHGCLLPALKVGRMKKEKNQLAGLMSKPAVRKIEEFCKKQDFILEIKNA